MKTMVKQQLTTGYMGIDCQGVVSAWLERGMGLPWRHARNMKGACDIIQYLLITSVWVCFA